MHVAMAGVDVERVFGIPEGDPIAHGGVPGGSGDYRRSPAAGDRCARGIVGGLSEARPTTAVWWVSLRSTHPTILLRSPQLQQWPVSAVDRIGSRKGSFGNELFCAG